MRFLIVGGGSTINRSGMDCSIGGFDVCFSFESLSRNKFASLLMIN